jgi:hypothetical protein
MHFFECTRGSCAHMLSTYRISRCIVVVAAVLLATLSFTTKASAQLVELRVSTSGLATPSGPDPGDSWTNAYRYLRDAIDYADFLIDGEAATEVEIWVQAGTYYPDENAANPASSGGTNTRSNTFTLRNEVRIYGGFVGGQNGETNKNQRNPATNITILSGDIQQDDNPGTSTTYDNNSYHVVTAERVLETAIIDGFTITAGNALGAPMPTCSGICPDDPPAACDYQLESSEVGGGMIVLGVPTQHICETCKSRVFGCKFVGSIHSGRRTFLAWRTRLRAQSGARDHLSAGWT